MVGQSSAITYQMLYDEPSEINKLFVQVQPFYSEISNTNTNGGFGVEAHYYHELLFDINLQGRSTYGKQFDIARNTAESNSVLDNSIVPYWFIQLGGTYHLKDLEKNADTKVVLYKKQFKGALLEAQVLKTTTIASKRREIIGIRGGGFIYNTSMDLGRLAAKQNQEVLDVDGNSLGSQLDYFHGNMLTAVTYVGGSYAWMHNFAINFDSNWEPGGNDLLLTTFFDILYSPFSKLDEIVYQNTNYSTENIELTSFGARVGLDGKFNRDMGWAYGAELGVRPGIKGGGFYGLLKLSFPVFGSDLATSVEALESVN